MEPSYNSKRLLWAGLVAIMAEGVGFSVRGAMLDDWSRQFGFTMGELGQITGGGLTGFGIMIIALSFLVDRLGFGKLMGLAFFLHIASAIVTIAATPVYATAGRDGAFWCLYAGAFLFALGNGAMEAVVNPMVATMFTKNKTHYLNIVHAGWPGGLVLGALLGVAFTSMGTEANPNPVRWEIQMCMFVIPTVAYGLMMLGQRFPQPETKAAGADLAVMLKESLVPVMLFLMLLHAMVGYVELGVDSWIQHVTGSILNNETSGMMLFIWTNILMFSLRFFAGPIVEKVSPVGLLFLSAVIGAGGLVLVSKAEGVAIAIIAVSVYGLGKTFYWPTMLAVASERYPKSGAIGMGFLGGCGMLSAGLLGGPGIGYKQDYNATKQLQEKNPATYARYQAPEKKGFLFFEPVAGLDGAKVNTLNKNGKNIEDDVKALQVAGKKLEDDKNLRALSDWWETAKATAKDDKPPIDAASLHGSRMAMLWTAVVPAGMAVGYLLLLMIFKAGGGYKQVHIEGGSSPPAPPG